MLFRYAILILAAVALVFSVYSTKRMQPVHLAAEPPSQPPRAAFPEQLGAVGLVEASSENVSVSLPVAGLAISVQVKAGDHVKKGQTLFVLDGRDLEAELKLRRSTMGVAQARLAKLEAGTRPEELPPAVARVREAYSLLEDARVQLKVLEAVRDRRAIREEDLLRRRRGVEAAQARLGEAEASLKLLEAGTWRPDLEVARAELLQSEQQIRRVEADLARLTVTAPMDGVIVQCKIRPGEYASTGVLDQPLILMGTADQLHIRADIDEKDAWRFKPGQDALGTVRGNAETRFPLSYVRTEPYVTPKKNLSGYSSERVDTRVLQVIYALPKGAKLYLGQQMDVSISTKEDI